MKTAPKKNANNWGFDINDLDTKLRPQDDFFNYASGGWFKKNPIPESESCWGSFTMLCYDTDKRLQKILKEIVSKKKVEKGSPEQMVRDLYRSAMDIETRAKHGTAPLSPWMKKISAIKDTKSLLATISDLHRIGVGVIWGFGVDQDSKDSTKYILHIGQHGLGMPDRDYYLKDDKESKRVRDAYVVHVAKMFLLAGATQKDSKQKAAVVLKVETELAKISMVKEDLRDPEKTYFKKTISQLVKLTPKLDWASYLKKIGAGKVSNVILMQPEYFSAVEDLLESISLDDWKVYLSWHLISDFAGVLSTSFVKENFNFYGKVLAGSKKIKPLWRQSLNAVNGNLGEQLGKIYVEKYFNEDSKKKVNEIVDDLFTAYEARIKQIDWMTLATKKKALTKLHMVTRKLGYPEKWKSYKGLDIVANDFAGNILRTTEFEHRREMKKLSGPIDYTEWHMYPQTVNAYCNFNMNEIVFPAAILQGAFFEVTSDDAINYGAIGSVIGHEITHAFDDQGAKFDGKGNMKTWWTDADKKAFEKKSKLVKDQFDGYVVSDGVKVNGQLTLGENIADLGGLSIAFDAYNLQLARTGRKDIDGFTPEQRFFLGYAQTEREAERPEFTKMMALTNPHSPSIFRVNGPLSNLPEFYKAFDVKKGDKLYRNPSEMAKIW